VRSIAAGSVTGLVANVVAACRTALVAAGSNGLVAALSAGLVIALFAAPAAAQGLTDRPADPADVESIEAIVAAFYDIVSGPAGQPRDWARDSTLYLDGARFTIIDVVDDRAVARTIDHDTFAREAAGLERSGFFEREVHRETRRWGPMANVWSTYEWSTTEDGPVGGRGINSIELFHDGIRWWITSAMWTGESDELPIPSEYLGTSTQDVEPIAHLFRSADTYAWHVRVTTTDTVLEGRVTAASSASASIEGVDVHLADVDRIEREVRRGGGGTRGALIGSGALTALVGVAILSIPGGDADLVAPVLIGAAGMGAVVGGLIGAVFDPSEADWESVWPEFP